MPYEIRDAVTGALLGAAATEAGALALVRAAILHRGVAHADSLVLERDDPADPGAPATRVAAGADLAALTERAPPHPAPHAPAAPGATPP